MQTVRNVFRRDEVLGHLDAVVEVPDLVSGARGDEHGVAHVLHDRVAWKEENKRKRLTYYFAMCSNQLLSLSLC